MDDLGTKGLALRMSATGITDGHGRVKTLTLKRVAGLLTFEAGKDSRLFSFWNIDFLSLRLF
ncbi:Uncharacterised protein [BD1-7 clade bacterium]|uniref:Uncharacterized protein n=1 Tax=BD1-7 clade bacterium TaxID=2029982 RepID=A0A5S9N4P6_9GAMM|nr:Uncharacterised protein [BD1-7 clade bacterium]CAA0084726.1 Uncharacterised protein [BD1-7 clade bacterium]